VDRRSSSRSLSCFYKREILSICIEKVGTSERPRFAVYVRYADLNFGADREKPRLCALYCTSTYVLVSIACETFRTSYGCVRNSMLKKKSRWRSRDGMSETADRWSEYCVSLVSHKECEELLDFSE
jgi:hypothetical protein